MTPINETVAVLFELQTGNRNPVLDASIPTFGRIEL
jgi:hypothetical protein